MSDDAIRPPTAEEASEIDGALVRISQALEGMPLHLAIAALHIVLETAISSLDVEERAVTARLTVRQLTDAFPDRVTH